MLSDLASILEREIATGANGAGQGGAGVAEGAVTAAVHLLQWDEQVVGICHVFITFKRYIYIYIYIARCGLAFCLER